MEQVDFLHLQERCRWETLQTLQIDKHPSLSSDGLSLGNPNHDVFHSHEPKGREIRNQRGERGHKKRFQCFVQIPNPVSYESKLG